MPALLDLYASNKELQPRERLVAIAKMFLGTPYEFGGKDARPLDGAHGFGRVKTIDCSGLVRAVYDECFPKLGFGSRDDLNVAKFRIEDLFVTVNSPRIGDIVCWDAHMGIVVDRDAGLFIHAPHTGDRVKISPYSSDYWAGAPNRLFRCLKALSW